MIVGWPQGVPFECLTNISVMSTMVLLFSTLKDSSCHWIRLTEEQNAAAWVEYQAKVAAGAIELKVWKGRSDAGVKRGPRKASGTASAKVAKKKLEEDSTEREEDNQDDKNNNQDNQDEDRSHSASYGTLSIEEKQAKLLKLSKLTHSKKSKVVGEVEI
jgi:hypothetical protein